MTSESLFYLDVNISYGYYIAQDGDLFMNKLKKFVRYVQLKWRPQISLWIMISAKNKISLQQKWFSMKIVLILKV